LVALFLILCPGCAANAEEAVHEKYADEIVNSFAREMQKEYGLICVGSGGRQSRDVETIMVSFNVYREITLEEARTLIVKAKERLVEKVNAHEKIRPFLREYPFTWRGADISLSFQKEDGSRYLDGSVAFVCSARGGRISYSKAELQKRKFVDILDEYGNILVAGKNVEKEMLVDLLEEPYEETLRIVQSNGKKDTKAR